MAKYTITKGHTGWGASCWSVREKKTGHIMFNALDKKTAEKVKRRFSK